MRKYRRIIRNKQSKFQSHQYFLMTLVISFTSSGLSGYIYHLSSSSKYFALIEDYSKRAIIFTFICTILLVIGFVVSYKNQERVTTFDLMAMSKESQKLSKKIKSLFNDKQITDVLKLSNTTRYGDEMPQICVWIADDQTYGYVAIENIANYERMDREKYEQRISGILSGKYRRFAVVSSELTDGDTYMLFHFEDMQTSNRLYVKDSDESLAEFIDTDVHAIRLSDDLIWHSNMTPHLSIIARTRSGKSVLAGRYMAPLMILQGWEVEYNSAKYDRYVKEFNGKSTAIEIVERAEYWVQVMLSRLDEINEADKEKYLEIENMNDVAVFFDEIGNLNAELELDKSLKKRWEVAVNKLSATGASAGIHIIAISQFATKEGFLPSLARVNCSDAVIMLGGAADSADERKYLMAGFADMPKRSYETGQGVARVVSSGRRWETPHFYETPWFIEK
ncbi:hypothetical protein NRIC_00360 [Enterococcus florum]|uniref:Cell division protein FtsK n=1 Tax=Enterococcus florum TaxID=2480627 RepID=A0A4P5P349_9ENTE|nr:cell division protein FtsK [Enterococcus florum]GCF92145.1 hypothetical protein NRIC_00360 [Enterococcus florum]